MAKFDWMDQRFKEMEEKAGFVPYVTIPEYKEFDPGPGPEHDLTEVDCYQSMSFRIRRMSWDLPNDYSE